MEKSTRIVLNFVDELGLKRIENLVASTNCSLTLNRVQVSKCKFLCTKRPYTTKRQLLTRTNSFNMNHKSIAFVIHSSICSLCLGSDIY